MKKYLAFILVIWTLQACETVVDVEPPPYTGKIVVNALFNTDEDAEVYVGYSVVALSNQSPGPLPDASVELFEDGVSQGQGTYDPIDQRFRWTLKPKAGSAYRLLIIRSGYPTVDKTLYMPSDGNLAGITYTDSIGLDTSGDKLAELRIRINDPADQKNYYRLLIAYYFEQGDEFLPFEIITNDPVLLSPGTEKENEGSYLFDDVLFNGRQVEIVVRFSPFIATGTPRFLIQSQSLSEDQYRYQLSLARYENNQGDPIAEPVFIYSNIDVGLGIYAGSIFRRDTIQ